MSRTRLIPTDRLGARPDVSPLVAWLKIADTERNKRIGNYYTTTTITNDYDYYYYYHYYYYYCY